MPDLVLLKLLQTTVFCFDMYIFGIYTLSFQYIFAFTCLKNIYIHYKIIKIVYHNIKINTTVNTNTVNNK